MKDMADVVVIGGGLYGTSIAWRLAEMNAGRVVIVEKSGIASGATGRSSANVQFNYSIEFLALIGLRAREVFQNFQEVTGGDSGFRQTGQFVLHAPEDTAAARDNSAMLQRAGLRISLISLDDVRKAEPLIDTSGVGVAFWEPEAGYADPVLTANSYAAAAKSRGAQFHGDTFVERIITSNGRVSGVQTDKGPISAPLVVVAAGYRSAELVRPLGVDVPLRPERHTISIVERGGDYRGTHPIVADRPLGIYFRPDGTRDTLIGSHIASHAYDDSEVEIHKRPNPAVESALAELFLRRYPSGGTSRMRRGYTGVYDCSPDLQFILGPVRAVPGLHLACGFSGHGFKFSPVIGQLVAERALTGRNAEFDISMFAVERFAEGRLISPTTPYLRQKT